MNNRPPLPKPELRRALETLTSDAVFQWVVAEQERLALARLTRSSKPTNIAEVVEREQNFGRVAAIADFQAWLGATVRRLDEEIKQEKG